VEQQILWEHKKTIFAFSHREAISIIRFGNEAWKGRLSADMVHEQQITGSQMDLDIECSNGNLGRKPGGPNVKVGLLEKVGTWIALRMTRKLD
jgi:hypothetical protein